MKRESYQVNYDARIITVCMSCSPGLSILTQRRELAGIAYFGFSHGICEHHKQMMLDDLNKRFVSNNPDKTTRHIAETGLTY